MSDLETHKEQIQICLNEASHLPGMKRVILYGSYAKGTQHADSDIDLAVFFDTEKTCLIEEYRALVHIFSTCDCDIQVQAFRSSELDDPCGIITEIVEYGIDLPVIQ